MTKNLSARRLSMKMFVLVPILGGCIYTFNEEIVAKPIDNHSIKIERKVSSDTVQRKVISIVVEDETILLNGKLVKLENFSVALNKITEDWSKEDLKNPWFEIDFSRSNTYYIERLNKEYRKSNLSQTSGTEFLGPSPVAPGGTPPPPPPPPVRSIESRESSREAESNSANQRENLFSIQVTGNTLRVNGVKTKPDMLSEALDKLSEGITDEELTSYNFRMQVMDPAPGFMKSLDREYKKSRMSKVTGHNFLPPPPPPAPTGEIRSNSKNSGGSQWTVDNDNAQIIQADYINDNDIQSAELLKQVEKMNVIRQKLDNVEKLSNEDKASLHIEIEKNQAELKKIIEKKKVIDDKTNKMAHRQNQ